MGELLNKKFHKLWKCNDRFVILYGSRQSSKSDFVAWKIIYKMINDPYFKGVAIYKDYNKLERNLVDTVLKVMNRWNLRSLFDYKKSPYQITCKQNGNTLFFGGLSDPSSYRGISDLTFCWFEETAPETEEDWSNISLTLRHPTALLQEYYTINPVIEDYENNWFYKKFFAGESQLEFRKKLEVTVNDKTYTQMATIHHSLYTDNKWCSEQAIASIELMALSSPYLYQVFKLGIWCNRIIEGRFFSRFDVTKHITDKKYNADKPLHCSFDFNRRPYSACTIFQIYDKQIFEIDEICILNRNITASPLKQTCDKIKEKYPKHEEGLYIYGDPAGRAEGSSTEQGQNDYTIIQNELSIYKPQLRVDTKAPAVKTSGEFINDIFENNFNGLSLSVNLNCVETLKDLQYLKIDKEGGKFIEKVKDEEGVQVEKFGHCFVGETMITTNKDEKRIDEIEIGDLVLTRQGYKPVINVFNNGLKKVESYRIGNKYITCTPEHKIYTEENGFMPVSQINSATFLEYNKEKSIICKLRSSITKELNSQDIQKGKQEQIGSIIEQLRVKGKGKDYIDLYGWTNLGKFQKDIIYTTLMATQIITQLITSNVWKVKSISDTTETIELRSRLENPILDWIKREKRQRNGINQTRGKNGTVSTPKNKNLEVKHMEKNVANNVEQYLSLEKKMLNFVNHIVPQNIGFYPELMMSSEIVNSVEYHSQSIDIRKNIAVVENVPPIYEKVYDIEVKDSHEYFANGILAHNCGDTLRYFIIRYFSEDYSKYKSPSLTFVEPSSGFRKSKYRY